MHTACQLCDASSWQVCHHNFVIKLQVEILGEIIGERITAGVRRAKAAGKRWGGRKQGDRYKLTDEKLRAVRQLLATGTKKTAIARQLGISRNSVYRAIEALREG